MNPFSKSPVKTPSPELRAFDTDPVHLMADTIGQLMEFWGFKHIMGRLWTILFLCPKPLSAPELAERLSVSSGNVSMALRDLLTWGAIHKVCPADSRKDHFVAESNIWKMVSRVLSEREGRRIETALSNMERALQLFQNNSLSGVQEGADQEFQIQRLEALQQLAKLGRQLLGLLVLRAKIDASPLQDFFRGSDSRPEARI